MNNRKNRRQSNQPEENILWNVLKSNMSEDEIYNSYFYREFWTLEQFIALLIGISPDKYENLMNKKATINVQDVKFIKKFNQYYRDFLKWLKKNKDEANFINGQLYLTTWKFVRWAAISQLPIKFKFFKSLPLYLMEIYLEYAPVKLTLRTKSEWRLLYHRALYLSHAQDLITKHNGNISNQEIYADPSMKYIEMTFKDQAGQRVYYTKRTLIQSWIPKIRPQQRGRPKN